MQLATIDEIFHNGQLLLPDVPEPTPLNAPLQPGQSVYLNSLPGGDSIPSDLINQPLRVEACLELEGVGWEVLLMKPNGEEVPFITLAENCQLTLPF